MNSIRISYGQKHNNSYSRPMLGAIALSKIIKYEYNLTHGVDFKWHFDTQAKNLVVEFNDSSESIATVIALRFSSVDLYELE